MKKRAWIIFGACLLAAILAIALFAVNYNKTSAVRWTEKEAIAATAAEQVQAIRVLRIPEGGSEDDAAELALTDAADIAQALELIGKLELGKTSEAAGESLVICVDTAEATYALSFVGDAAALENGEYREAKNLAPLRDFLSKE